MFSSNLGIIVHAIVKIVVGFVMYFVMYNFDYCLVQLFPNRTRMCVITYTNMFTYKVLEPEAACMIAALHEHSM